MSNPVQITKQPAELLKLTVDFTDYLSSGDTLTGPLSVSSTIIGSDSASDLVIDNETYSSDNLKVNFDVSGGTDDFAYQIRIVATTVDGETVETDVILLVRELIWYPSWLIGLRVLINDLSTTQEFSDDRLRQVLIVAAYQVNVEIDLDTDYNVDIVAQTIDPDPISDDIYSNFVILKAACILDHGKFRTRAALSGLRAKCGPVEMQTTAHLEGFKNLIDFGPCKTYEILRNEFEFSGTSHIKAILSPFINTTFDPSYGRGSNIVYHDIRVIH